MREIKFRIWDGENNKMIYDEIRTALHLILAAKGKPIAKCELMQFTGLKDRNGWEIYEGDIVKFDAPNIPYITVIWDDYIAGFNGTKDAYLESQVIGNIYEQPELLS